MTSRSGFSIDLNLRGGYQFAVDFRQDKVPELIVDEQPPLGEGMGPDAGKMLAAAVGQCIGSSLLFCLRRAGIEVDELRTRVEGTVVRNEQGRLRIGGLRVELYPQCATGQLEAMERCLERFEEFCTVGQSVRQGIPLEIDVRPVVPAG